jgi:hypothetical protein
MGTSACARSPEICEPRRATRATVTTQQSLQQPQNAFRRSTRRKKVKALKDINAGSILVHVVFFYGAYSILAPIFGLLHSTLAHITS